MKTGKKTRTSVRDAWDKADIIGKILSGVLLAIIALTLKFGTDRIAASLQTGDLVKSLISDLTTKDQRARQDIALIALNHSIGDRQPKLVAEIAERIYRDVVETSGVIDDAQLAFGSVALSVLAQRDRERAENLQNELLKDHSADLKLSTGVTDTVAAGPGGGEGKAPAAAALDRKKRLLQQAFSNLVYIQFRGEHSRDAADALREWVLARRFYAPGTERVDRDYQNMVIYFHKADEQTAEQLLAVVEQFRLERKLAQPFKLRDLSSKGYRARPGQLEIWMNQQAP